MKQIFFALIVSTCVFQTTFQQSVGKRLKYLEKLTRLQTRSINSLTNENKILKEEFELKEFQLREEIEDLKNRTSVLESYSNGAEDVSTIENETMKVNENGMIPTIESIPENLYTGRSDTCDDICTDMKELNKNFKGLNKSFTSLNQKVTNLEANVTKIDIKCQESKSVTKTDVKNFNADAVWKCFTSGPSSESIILKPGSYYHFMIGGGAPGCNGHNPGGAAGFIDYGSFSTSGGPVTVTVGSGGIASRTAPSYKNYPNMGFSTDSASCFTEGNRSKIVVSGVEHGSKAMFEAYGGKIAKKGTSHGQQNKLQNGSSGGGGNGNAGEGGKGGSGGSDGLSGSTVPGGIGMGSAEFQKAITFLEEKLRLKYPNAWVGAGNGGAPSSHLNLGYASGGGGAGGISIKNVNELSPTPHAKNGVHLRFQPGTGGIGFGAGGGAGGYGDHVYQDGGDGADGFVCIFQQQ